MRLMLCLEHLRGKSGSLPANGPYKEPTAICKGRKGLCGRGPWAAGRLLLQAYDDRTGMYGFLLSNPAHFDSLARELAGTISAVYA